MATRTITHSEDFPTSAARLFSYLHTPSAIRQWWGIACVIIIPEQGGIWTAAWGDDEDDPDYIGAATIETFKPPERVVLANYHYQGKTGPLPFAKQIRVTYDIAPKGDTMCKLTVIHEGIPQSSDADDYYHGCIQGWCDTFTELRNFIETQS